jgi:hypothetical protein
MGTTTHRQWSRDPTAPTGRARPDEPDPTKAAGAPRRSLTRMQIVSALFVENFEMRQATGGATRIDLTGVMFSMAAPSPVPVTVAPHLVALIYCPPGESGQGVFEVVFRTGVSEDDEQIARNVSPFTVDPGKFTYRLVRGELEFPEYRQIIAHCRVGHGPWHLVPFTLLPPV